MAHKSADFDYSGEYIVLNYYPRDGTKWISDIFNETDPTNTYHRDDDGVPCVYLLNKQFTLRQKNVVNIDEDSISFNVAKLIDGYYVFDSSILADGYSLKIERYSKIPLDYFLDIKRNHVFKILSEIVGPNIVIGDKEGEISPAMLVSAYHKYPTQIELKRYVKKRVADVLIGEMDLSRDYEKSFQRYVEKRVGKTKVAISPDISILECEKYRYILNKLEGMLEAEGEYSETQWQVEIMKIILLLYPKYVCAFRETVLEKSFGHGKRVDFMLVDSYGYVDVVEIKKPSYLVINVRPMRNNYVPSSIVSSTVIQVENYLFVLSRWGECGEEKITEKYRSKIPEYIKSIKISNPRGMIIIGNSTGLNDEQVHALELIKRQYARVVDFMTYDDMIELLRRLVEKFEKNQMNDE